MYAFVFGPVAVTSEHFETVEPDGSHEFGTRLQVRRVNSDVVDAQRQAAGRDGLHTTIGDPIWRADLFGVVGGPPDNHAHAHYHPTFDGMQPCEREFAPGIVADPIGWARGQGADGPLDLHVQDGRIADLLTPGAAMDGANDYDVSGAIVAPGLVDLHGHWYEGSPWGIDPLISLRGGVTTPCDAGTTGYENFGALRRP